MSWKCTKTLFQTHFAYNYGMRVRGWQKSTDQSIFRFMSLGEENFQKWVMFEPRWKIFEKSDLAAEVKYDPILSAMWRSNSFNELSIVPLFQIPLCVHHPRQNWHFIFGHFRRSALSWIWAPGGPWRAQFGLWVEKLGVLGNFDGEKG